MGGDHGPAVVVEGAADAVREFGASVILVGTTESWNLQNELGCHWQDPALGIPWPLRLALR